MKRVHTDILVVGAGPTGLVLSNLLGSYGINSVLVERNSTTGVEPRAVSIDDESLRTLQAIGIVDSFLPLISKNYGSHYLTPNGKTFAVIEPSQKKYGFHKRNGFDQPQLEDLLLKNLKKFSCIETYFNSSLKKTKNEKQHVTSVILGKNDYFEVKSKYVVACDGGTSALRKRLGIELTGSSFNERWLIVDLFDTDNKFRHTQVHCDSKRPCITLPGPKGIRRYEFKLQHDECKEGSCDEDFLASLFKEKGHDVNSKVRRNCVYTFHALVADRWRQGNIFLAGDSAHLSPPFAGQGMNSGVRDAHNLAWKLCYAIKFGNEEILDTYEIERKSHVWDMINISILMGRILAPKNSLSSLIIRVLFFVLSIYKPARTYISEMRFKPEPSFKKGLLWKSPNTEKNSMIGRLFPQPLVEDAYGNQFLLDNLFTNKSGNVIVIFSNRPERLVESDLTKAFKKRGITIIGVTPEWMNPTIADFSIVRDVSGLMSTKNLIRYLDQAFFIRPDRYVASISDKSSLNSFLLISDAFQNKA